MTTVPMRIRYAYDSDQTHNPTVDSDPDYEIKFGPDSYSGSDTVMGKPKGSPGSLFGSDTA